MDEDVHDVVQRLGQAELAGVVGRDDSARLTPQRVVGRQRLRVGDVEARAKNFAAAQGLHEGVAVHGGAAAHVDEDGPVLAAGKALGVEQLVGLRGAGQAQGDEVGLGQLLVQLALGHHTQAVVRAGRVGVDRAADAHHLSAQHMGAAGEVGADVAHADAEHPRPGDAPHGAVDGRPLALVLAVAVEEHILLDAQPHGQHPLADGQTVGTGGVGHHAVFGQDAGLQIGVGAGGVGLEPLDVLVLADHRHRCVAQHDVGPEHIFGVDIVQRVETEFKFRHGCLQRGAVGVVQGQTYQNFFVHRDTLTSCVFFYKDTLPRPAPQEAKWPLS